MTSTFLLLQAAGAPGGWGHVVDQIGMFSFTGLTPPQVPCHCRQCSCHRVSSCLICSFVGLLQLLHTWRCT